MPYAKLEVRCSRQLFVCLCFFVIDVSFVFNFRCVGVFSVKLCSVFLFDILAVLSACCSTTCLLNPATNESTHDALLQHMLPAEFLICNQSFQNVFFFAAVPFKRIDVSLGINLNVRNMLVIITASVVNLKYMRLFPVYISVIQFHSQVHQTRPNQARLNFDICCRRQRAFLLNYTSYTFTNNTDLASHVSIVLIITIQWCSLVLHVLGIFAFLQHYVDDGMNELLNEWMNK